MMSREMIDFYCNNGTKPITTLCGQTAGFGMWAGLSVQSHAVFIKQLLLVSTVVANNEMCGSGGRRSDHKPAL